MKYLTLVNFLKQKKGVFAGDISTGLVFESY
jgi:hypothetical protein